MPAEDVDLAQLLLTGITWTDRYGDAWVRWSDEDHAELLEETSPERAEIIRDAEQRSNWS